ncbi:hypothetical protein SNEBB_011005 [Seison nebaliae]|nr:hypothetical protein SNEBB_011005 [Seison nebaliae]
MYSLILLLIVGLTAAIPSPTNDGTHWAVLVAGSNGWYNYRHQADICHSYQILRNHGIPDENIIVMMDDDLAHNPQNPTPGIVINHLNGSDVYHGVLKDYTGEEVTPDNFLNVIQGNKAAMQGKGSGRVIESGPNDNIFIYFADHGAPGLIAFPYGVLYAGDLNDAIKNMYKQNKYKKMVFYVEACESGSMFDNLLADNINVYATTAANGQESSYACYYDDLRSTYLGDVYSVKWMEDSDIESLQMETLKKQYQIVKSKTTTSHVMQYGNLTIGKTHVVGEFQGEVSSMKIQQKLPEIVDAIKSDEVELATLFRKFISPKYVDQHSAIKKEIYEYLHNEKVIDSTIEMIASHLSRRIEHRVALVNEKSVLNKNTKCYKNLVNFFHENCHNLNENSYALRKLRFFVNICEMDLTTERRAIHAMKKTCQ